MFKDFDFSENAYTMFLIEIYRDSFSEEYKNFFSDPTNNEFTDKFIQGLVYFFDEKKVSKCQITTLEKILKCYKGTISIKINPENKNIFENIIIMKNVKIL